MCNTPVEVQFTSAGCLNYPCRTPVVYAKRPFGGPEEVLRYLARYTHRVAISNRRLTSVDDKGVTFKWKDYRLDGAERYIRVMTLDTSEFIRRFLMHVLPSSFHRIRHVTLKTRVFSSLS
jgi:hypothetical protein